MGDSAQHHRWVVDSIEESVASVEVDGSTMMTVPQWLLPAGVHAGHVLSVQHSRPADGQRSTLAIEIDETATKAALEASAAQVAQIASRSRDPGGDVSL